MRHYFLGGLLVLFGISFAFSQIPDNFNNQKNLVSRIEENISLIKNMTQNILDNPANSPQTRSDLVTSALKKDSCSDEISEIISDEFLQKYILPTDPEINVKLLSVCKIMNICFQLKTKVDMDLVQSLEKEFKLFKELMKLNYQIDPDYKPLRYKKYVAPKDVTPKGN